MLQETLLRAWQVAPRVAPDGRPNGLLRLAQVTARNLAVSELRRTRAAADPAAEATPAAEVEAARPDPFLRAAIARCRELLPPRPALALTARLDAAGLTTDHELAAGLAMKLNTFLQNFGRARRMLADCLRRAGVELEEELP